MGFRKAVGGIKSAGGDAACGVVTPSVFKSMFRIDGLRGHLSYTEYMGFRQTVGGIKSAGGDAACGVVTPSVFKSMFRIVFLCVAEIDYNAFCACCFCFRLKQIYRHPVRILDRNFVGIAPYFVERNDFHFAV